MPVVILAVGGSARKAIAVVFDDTATREVCMGGKDCDTECVARYASGYRVQSAVDIACREVPTVVMDVISENELISTPT